MPVQQTAEALMSPTPWRLEVCPGGRAGADVVDAEGRMVCALRGHSRRWREDGPVVALAPEMALQLASVLDWWERAGHACVVPEPAWVRQARELLGRLEGDDVDEG